jgi:TonB-linked SusC/RagA family outer membrane protein
MRNKKTLLILSLLFMSTLAIAQKVVTGTVTDTAGAKLPGVSILIPGTTKGTVTDESGTFRISVPNNVTNIEISLIGFQKQTLNVSNGTEFNATLTPTAYGLSDVVVVGYGVQRKRDVTGTISTIKGDDFKNLPVATPAAALQGRASGVDVVRADGAPGSVPKIRIRGTGTINSADPLVVIDGVPAGSLSDVNPNDISSIEVLKDASSSAIYGTRAANGVILVTTKKGSFNEKIKVSLNAYTGTSEPIKYLDLLTAPELVELKKESFTNDNSPVSGIWNDPYYATQRTDWQRALIGNGKTKNADIAVRGGSETSTFSFSGNYYDEEGMIDNTNFKRLSARINSEHRLLKIIKVGENLLYSSTSGNAIDTRSTQTGTVWSALRFNPAIPVKNDDGSWGTSKADNELGDINNPVFTATSPDVRNKTNNILTNAYIEVDIVKGLKVKANFGYAESQSTGSVFQPAEPNQTRAIPLAQQTNSSNETSSTLEEYTLNYSNIFAQSHSVNFTGGYSAQVFKGRGFRTWRQGYDDPSPPLRNLDNGNPSYQFNEGRRAVNSGLVSYFGRVNYGYKGRYLLTATLRVDGSSKFPEDNQYGYFPAFSAGWRISDEDFFKNRINFISDLKLTAGYGELGNQEVPNLQYLAIIRTDQGYVFGDAPVVGTAVGSLANPNITWERAQMTNVSLEFGLMQNKLRGTITYFDKNTKDMLIPYSLTETYGIAGIPNQNIGTLNNHGIETDLSYQNRAGDLTYSISVNASFIKNKVTLLYGDTKNYIGSAIYGRQLLETSRTYEGQPIASFYGFKTNGLYQNAKEIQDDPNITNDPNKENIVPGDVRFVDQNSDGIIDDADRVYLGNPHPKAVYGINGNLEYKHFDLSFSFAGVSGVSLYNADRVAGLDATSVFNWYKDQKNRWNGEGTSNSVPRLTRRNLNNNYRSSDMWIEDGSYLALKNITIGYTLPKFQISGQSLPQIRVYASCYNAFYITDYSGFTPELGYTDDNGNNNKQRGVDVAQYPSARTILFGASVNF